jgi:glutathione S-transferase
MKLYYYPNTTACRRVLAVAFHLQLPLELLELPLGDDGHPNTRRARQLNPGGRVPVLEDGTFSLWESNAIMQYLCTRKISQSLFPEEEKPRLDISRWQFWQAAHFESACEKGKTDEFRENARVLEMHLKTRRFLVGEAISLADFSVGSCLQHWQTGGIPLEEFRNLKDWYSHLESTDAWKKSAPRAR